MKQLFFVSLALMIPLIPASADDAINPERPGFTNGAATVGKQVFQLEEGLTRSEGKNKFGDGGLLRYGIAAQTELRLGLPSWQRTTGFSSASYGLKTTLCPQLGLIVQTSGERHTQTQAALEAEFSLTREWTLQVDAVRDSQWASGFNFGRSLTQHLGMFVEGYHTNGWHGDGGLTYQLTTDQQVDLSGGDHFVSIGYTWRLR
ncbi:hypothetical protein [Armatimonas sp.]|uniref:hypothetical protein n=1 Tax=Armatimonas sp. TaxID=1872638 RepID=UPI003750CF6F